MKWLKSIFLKNDEQSLKLMFSSQNNSWMVVRNREILYLGDENHCQKFIKNFEFEGVNFGQN